MRMIRVLLNCFTVGVLLVAWTWGVLWLLLAVAVIMAL